MSRLSLAIAALSILLFATTSKAGENKPSFLIIPYIEFSEAQQTVFLKKILPLLTLEGKLINTGTRKDPWYCIEYKNKAQAQSEKKNIGAVFDEYQIEFKTQISSTCAAG